MYDTIIIGGGVAGITAAIYAARRKMKTLVLTIDTGGQLGKITEIENWPGEEKISGTELATKLSRQLQRFELEIKYTQATKIDFVKGVFTITTGAGNFQAKSIILAFGKVPRNLGIKGEDEFIGRGVSYCATCDAPFFKNKIVAVMGGGNSALDAAILLSKIAAKVYLIHRREEFRGDKHLLEILSATPKIETVLKKTVIEVRGSQRLETIVLDDGSELKVDGLFIEAGYVVNNALVKDLLECNEAGSIIVDKRQSTSMAGIFAAGDMTDAPFQQLVIAAGEGATAALSAYEYLQTK